MKALLDTYVRSLLEQEPAGDAPEYRQDLGTFVDWLLERQGFDVHLRSYRHKGTSRHKATGRIQWGRDLLATKVADDGKIVGYRFVLKHGDIGQSQWHANEDGSLPHDLELAADLHPSVDAMHTLGDDVDRWVVVAVHNGDFDTDRIGPQRVTLVNRIKSRGIGVEWWDASELVRLAMLPPAGPALDLAERADPSLLPPGARPFARLALDSLVKGRAGSQFDLEAVDRFLDAVLPTDVQAKPARLFRVVSEMALFAGMIDVESRSNVRVAGSTLPALDTVERIVCRSAHHCASLAEDGSTSGEQKRLTKLLHSLLEQYAGIAHRLLTHLAPIRSFDRGLAIGSPSERVDYPIRALRLSGYLASAGAACLDLGQPDQAREFALLLRDLWSNNPGGALTPVLDDQIVEIALVWELWQRLGMHDAVRETARELVARMLVRLRSNLPLPALSAVARVPLEERVVRLLVEAQFPRSPGSQYEDGGSLLLPLALYLAYRDAPAEEASAWLASFRSRETNQAPNQESDDSSKAAVALRTVHMQSWLPPDDAPATWYSQGLPDRGTAHVFVASESFNEFAKEFERFNRALSTPSVAERLGLPAIDRIAWKVMRNPPPLALFIPRGAAEARPSAT